MKILSHASFGVVRWVNFKICSKYAESVEFYRRAHPVHIHITVTELPLPFDVVLVVRRRP